MKVQKNLTRIVSKIIHFSFSVLPPSLLPSFPSFFLTHFPFSHLSPPPLPSPSFQRCFHSQHYLFSERRKQWRQPTIKNPSKVETVLQNDIVSSSSLSQTQELNDFVDATRDEPFSRIDHSTLARDSDSTTLPSSAFFDRKSPDLFSSSSLSSSLPQPSSDVPFPRKLPEINSKSSEDTDHRAIAIESLQQLLAGIKYFDR